MAELERHQRRNVGGARRVVHRDHGNQHQDGPEEGVEEELERSIDAVLAAPDADDQEHRDQASLKEHIEQHQIQRAEHAEHQGFQQQKRDHVVLDPRLHRPAGGDGDRHQEGGQHDEQDRNPVDAHLVVQAQNPRLVLNELKPGVAGVEPFQQKQRQHQTEHRGKQRHPTGIPRRRRIIAAQEQRKDTRRNRRDEGDNREKIIHQCAPPESVIQVIRIPIPITIAKA